MIDFYIANSPKEIKRDDKFISMEDNVKDKIYKLYKNNDLGEGFGILAKLDRYGERILDIEEVEDIIQDIEDEIPLDEIHVYVANFLKNFIDFGREAIDNNIKICAIGD